jgi:hypothetical protein
MEEWRHNNYLHYVDKLNPLEKEFYQTLYEKMDVFQAAIGERMAIIAGLLAECQQLSEESGIPFDFSKIDAGIISVYYPTSTSDFYMKQGFSEPLNKALLGLFGSSWEEDYPTRIGWQPSQLGC